MPAPVSLDDIVGRALEHNNMLQAGRLRVMEKRETTEEMKVRRFPTLSLNSMYMYRFNLGQFSLPAGTLGTFQMATGAELSLPQLPVTTSIGEHHGFLAGATLYQPVTQQWQLTSAIKATEIDRDIAYAEYSKAELQVVNGVERLFYNVLAVRKRIEEIEKRIASAERRLYDAESALAAGKTIDATTMGLTASLASQQQELLKLRNEESDHFADLRKLTGMDYSPMELSAEITMDNPVQPLSCYLAKATASNVELRLADLDVSKARQGLAVAKRSYLPDMGLIAGYNYQNSVSVFPDTNSFIGASFSWNIQDVFSNRHTVRQRRLQLQQAVEKREHTSRSTAADVEKAYRRLVESGEVTDVAAKAAQHGRRNLEVAYARQAAGLNTATDVLDAEAECAKSEADCYAAMAAMRVAMANLVMLCGL